jgi:cytoskeletal protein CcmA (bactofilin family)
LAAPAAVPATAPVTELDVPPHLRASALMLTAVPSPLPAAVVALTSESADKPIRSSLIVSAAVGAHHAIEDAFAAVTPVPRGQGLFALAAILSMMLAAASAHRIRAERSVIGFSPALPRRQVEALIPAPAVRKPTVHAPVEAVPAVPAMVPSCAEPSSPAVQSLPPSAPAQAAPLMGASFLTGDLIVTGNLVVETDVVVACEMRGDITGHSVWLNHGASVLGHITADTVIIAGNVVGLIDAVHVTLLQGGYFKGEIRCVTITVEHGAILDASITRTGAEAASPLPISMVMQADDQRCAA